MTRDPVGRRGVGTLDILRRLDAGTMLTTILVLGLALRVLIAGVYLPLSGLGNDIGAFSAWGQQLARVGPAEFYEPGYFSDYPPGYLYVLWLLGEIGGALQPLIGVNATGGLVKIPGILADIGVAWLLFQMVRRWGGELMDPRRFRIGLETAGLAVATVYLFNPGTIFTSAVWGQIDSVGTLILLATLYALGRGWTEVAAVGAVVAMLVKFQFGFLIPVVAVVGLKRHAFGRSSDPAHHGRRDWLRVVTSVAAGVAAMSVLILPFGMGLWSPPAPGAAQQSCLGFLPQADPSTSLIGKLCEASNTYGGLSVNAFNIWRNPVAGIGDDLGHWGDDTVVGLVLGGLSLTWQQVGTILFALVAMLVLWQVARRDDVRGLVLGSLVLAIAFFALPTRVHERYLFPALALGALLLFAGRAWPWLYAALSVSFFANVYWVYTEDWSFAGPRVNNPGIGGAPMPQDAFLTSTLLTDGGIWLLGLLVTVVLGIVAWRAVRLAISPRELREIETDAIASALPASPIRLPSFRLPGSGWLAPNPADAYLGERFRRLDRRDALLLLGLVAFALVFRLWRLDLPRSQHFDEAYHARSAAEFLSAWQNDWDRDVYEWTHPMLAKYLIAGGIVLADPNKVVGETDLQAPSPVLAVAPRRASAGHERSIAFTVADGSTIIARDAETGEEVARWDAGGQVATLAYQLDGVRLLVGRADAGTVETFELAGLLASPDGRAPPAGPPIESGLETVNEIVLPREAGDPILLRGTGGATVVEPDTDEVRGTVEGAFAGAAYVRGETTEDPDWVVASDPAARSLAWFDAETFEPRAMAEPTEVDVALAGPILARGGGQDQQLLALTGELPATVEHPGTAGGIAVFDADGSNARCGNDPCLLGLVPLPGAPFLMAEQRASGLLYVAGTTADGDPQVWPVEPHMEPRGDGTIGMAAFDAVALDGAPLAMAFDSTTTSPGDDRGRLLVSTAAGSGGGIVRVDAGSNAFGWRLAGVIFGAALVGLVYLLVATMFGRRRIAVLAAAFVALDPMSYAMSRISMNDIFVATFIVAAYLVFWQVWSGRWARSAWWGLPLVGVLIGLAAASKWVGFYALAGLLVLVLARSHLGRLLLVMLAALALVLGAVGGPWPFLLVMLGILGIALVITWAKPIRLDPWESISALAASAVVFAGVGLAFVLAFDGVEGAREPRSAVEYVFGMLARGAEGEWPVWLMIGVAGVLVAWRAWRSLRDPRSDARWFQPSEMGGFAWSWVGACLIVIPIVVYGLTYIPYLQLGHDWVTGGGPGYGWSIDELHAQMFGYHFNLTAGHASASPWWSWPLGLKPTWFHIGNFDSRQVAVIYNGGNPILLWAGIPALVACAVLAWKRRSMALVLVVAAFAFQYVPWIRIERATFAYHYLTAVLFAMIAIAYVVDELLRRPAWRDLAIGYLVLAAIVGVLIFPLGSALPMPDWYINAARALPPWNFDFKFPDPPTGDREELLDVGVLKAVAGLALAAVAGWFALAGRGWLERRALPASAPPPEPMTEGG